MSRASVAIACLAVVLCSATASHAEQPRDYMLGFQPAGTFLSLDYYGTGAQLTLENRRQIYGAANDLTLSASLVPSYPIGEANARADLRILFFGIGTTVGYRAVWRELTFEADPNGYCLLCNRAGRRTRDSVFGQSPGTSHWGYAEVRGSLFMPFNDYVVGVSTFALRYEHRQDRSFDWVYTSVYDRGMLSRWETQLFFKHRDWGGIGPFVQRLELPRGDRRETQWAYGFNAVTRPGFLRSNDLLFLTFLMRLGDDSYGQHNYYLPVRALLVYRMMLEL